MIIATIRPSTLDGVKKLAKKIRRERNITHTEALEDASRQAGYENFMHAKHQFEAVSAHRGCSIYLSVHWRAPHERNGEPRPNGPRAGCEILCVKLSRPLSEIVAKHRVSRGRGLCGFRMEYEDHLEHLTDVWGQDEARETLLTAVRGLRFMEATGLQPVSTKRYDDLLQTLKNMPGLDHASHWFDPTTNGYVHLDEPYTDHSEERQHWLVRNNLQAVSPKWEGIHSPGRCLPHLVSPDGALLHRVAGALAKVQPMSEPGTWPPETGPYSEDFFSPKRQADEKSRRPRPGPSWCEHKGATPYGGAPGVPSRWRPTKPMSFNLHQKLALLMRSLCVGFSGRVDKKLSTARSRLEDWLISEHENLHGDAVHHLYYDSSIVPVCKTDAERLAALTAARAIVVCGYDECKPRRALLAAIDSAISEMRKSKES